LKRVNFTDNLEEIFLRGVPELLVTANVVTSSLIPFTLMMEAIRPSETSVLTRARRRHSQEDGILHSYRRGTSNLEFLVCGFKTGNISFIF
jgi:hypothetical protein